MIRIKFIAALRTVSLLCSKILIKDFLSIKIWISIQQSWRVQFNALENPKRHLQNILEVANQCVITLPNFGNWELRTGLLKGKMPSSSQLPARWYETKNLHLCTIADFEELCETEGFKILKKVYLNKRGNTSWLTDYSPNLFAAEAVYLLGK